MIKVLVNPVYVLSLAKLFEFRLHDNGYIVTDIPNSISRVVTPFGDVEVARLPNLADQATDISVFPVIKQERLIQYSSVQFKNMVVSSEVEVGKRLYDHLLEIVSRVIMTKLGVDIKPDIINEFKSILHTNEEIDKLISEASKV